MLHYKASELIRRAMILANLENSSFISAEENRQNINDIFAELYQVAIDKGETYYIKTLGKEDINFENGIFELPPDFYQLAAVKDSYGNDVKRKNRNSFKNSKCYDIRKREVVHLEPTEPEEGEEPELEEVTVNATCMINYNNANITEIEYYPVPDTLDIEGEGDVELALPSNAFYQCMLYGLAVYYKVRQNEDTSALQALYDEKLATYTDTIQVDDNEYMQMRDVYRTYNNIGSY